LYYFSKILLLNVSVYEYDAVHLGPAQAIYTSPSYRCSSFYVGLSVSPDDRFLLCGSSDKSAYIWCLDKTPYKTIASLRLHGHTQEVSQVAWCPHDQDQLSTCSDDGTVRIWRIDHTTAQACRQSEAMRQHYGFVTSE
jgi:denticleless